jgi:hypothetical protein
MNNAQKEPPIYLTLEFFSTLISTLRVKLNTYGFTKIVFNNSKLYIVKGGNNINAKHIKIIIKPKAS